MNWLWLGVAASLVLSVLALALALAALRAGRELQRVRASHRRLENELAVSNSAAIGMGNRLLAMEKRLGQEGGSSPPQGESQVPYTEAQQLFRMGESVETVSRRCGLSRAEASLLQAMQEQGAPGR